MSGERMWRLAAVCGLLLAAFAIGAVFRKDMPVYGQVQAGGGGVGSVIAFTSDNESTVQRMYLVDTGQKVILVYQSSQPGDTNFKFVYGRTYAYEAELATYGEIKFNPTGYSPIDMKRELDKVDRATKPR